MQDDILKIGDGEGEISPAVLGFNEIYFQYFIPLSRNKFTVFPLEHESMLQKGFLLEFDGLWNFKSSTPIADLSPNTMRPTAVVLENSHKNTGQG